MRTSVINRFAKNVRPVSVRRGLAAVATTVVLAGGVQVLAAGEASACAGPYKANNPTVSQEARERHHNGDPVSAFLPPFTSMTTGSATELGVEFVNFTGAAYDLASPSLTLKGNHLRVQDVTVEVMISGAWTKLGVDEGCGGEAVRVDTSPLMQHLDNGRASREMFRITLAANAPKGLTSVSLSTSASGEGSTGHSAVQTRTFKVVHPGDGSTAPAKPAPTKKPAAPAAEKTTAAPTAAPATTAPAGTPELAQTGAAENNTFLAVSSAVLLALGAGVLIAVRRLRPQR
ncbi:LPXTG cell wall anchor domain-containing protein [Kitasatospora sp. NPDC101183]|uniref:LPXTG cell wall anchor domain-containing protein n=1 Tax=Kitasatospora sp. NPDC101183 TaxID=3364100 RepID=UPI0038041B1F